jgi:gluconate 2-dehydrogenase gamma chain
MSSGLSRREWLAAWSASLAVAWHEVVAAEQHAHDAARASGTAPFTYFTRETAAEVEAVAAQIIPATDTPGAREAGVIYFIDRALTTFDRDQQKLYRTGMAQLQAKRARMFPRSRNFASLATEQQLALVQAIEDTPFFDLIRFHTMLGFFGSSRDASGKPVGWALLGIEDRTFFQPPFGYYDAQANDGN